MEVWKKCSTCKKDIGFQTLYYNCSVSSCNSKRTGYVFCSVDCFDSHVPGARHKDAGAIEMKSPQNSSKDRSPQRRIISNTQKTDTNSLSSSSNEILIIASRLKDFIHSQSEFSTSGSVMNVLSDHIRMISAMAIDNARSDGRKTVMDRDFQFLKHLK